jgi:hypothetical protein
MRMDQIWPGTYSGQYLSLAQMYPSCAQLNIKSNNNTALPKGVKIPEALIHQPPGMSIYPNQIKLMNS